MKKKHEYSLADILNALESKKADKVSEIARMFPTIMAVAYSNPLAVARSFGDKGGITAERKLREALGLEMMGKAEKDAPEPDEPDGDEPEEKAEKPAKAAKPKAKPAKTAKPAEEPEEKPSKKEKGKGKVKDEDELDALLSELDDEKPEED